MEATLVQEKEKITKWINSLKDKTILDKVSKLMEAEKEARFEKEFAEGMTGDELIKDLFEYIDSLPWKENQK